MTVTNLGRVPMALLKLVICFASGYRVEQGWG